jgi:8-amino-7-oxononanoate synthase
VNKIQQTLENLTATGNLRTIPAQSNELAYDFSSNDYLGLSEDVDLRADFLRSITAETFLPSSSASRLLSARQNAYSDLEKFISSLYGRSALLFNSGYHANTGMIGALGSPSTLFVADKLVHASIIDGLVLSKSKFERFKHNDYEHACRIIERYGKDYDRVVIVAESVYSMDGDMADIDKLVAAKRLHKNALLYVDEAHAVGVLGESGLGLCRGKDVDIIVGTFGKALASEGAFAVMSEVMREYMVNRCRSLIFSTALSPFAVMWSMTTLRCSLQMDEARARLHNLAAQLQTIIGSELPSHIQPYIVGDAQRCVQLSKQLLEGGAKVLPIRTPTVPPGTERLRFSLSAALPNAALEKLAEIFKLASC